MASSAGRYAICSWDYLAERQLSLDFSSLNTSPTTWASCSGGTWKPATPGISSLKLARDVAAAWKQRVMTRTTNNAHTATTARPGRAAPGSRAQHLDHRPGVLPLTSPNGPGTTRLAGVPGSSAARSPHTARPAKRTGPGASPRMDQRTRERLPVLPALAAFAGRQQQAGRRAAQRRAGHDPGRAVHRRRADPATVGDEDQDDRAHWAEAPGTSTGKRRDLTFEEHRAFWTWATVEVLRHTASGSRS